MLVSRAIAADAALLLRRMASECVSAPFAGRRRVLVSALDSLWSRFRAFPAELFLALAVHRTPAQERTLAAERASSKTTEVERLQRETQPNTELRSPPCATSRLRAESQFAVVRLRVRA